MTSMQYTSICFGNYEKKPNELGKFFFLLRFLQHPVEVNLLIQNMLKLHAPSKSLTCMTSIFRSRHTLDEGLPPPYFFK